MSDEWEWETQPFTPADLAFIQQYATEHYGEIDTLVANQVWSRYTFQTVLADCLLGAVVNAQNPTPQDRPSTSPSKGE